MDAYRFGLIIIYVGDFNSDFGDFFVKYWLYMLNFWLINLNDGGGSM